MHPTTDHDEPARDLAEDLDLPDVQSRRRPAHRRRSGRKGSRAAFPPEGMDAADTDRRIDDGWPLSDRNRPQDHSQEVTLLWCSGRRLEESTAEIEG